MLLDVPPRFMWGWGHNVSGYCGSMSIQTVGLYYGNYLSQDKVRGMTGGHDGRHEIMLGMRSCWAEFVVAVAPACIVVVNVDEVNHELNWFPVNSQTTPMRPGLGRTASHQRNANHDKP